jgi:hypothetical protein
MTYEQKVQENRVRRAAARQGMRLEKSRLRDQRATLWNTYQLTNVADSSLELGLPGGYGFSLDEVESFLARGRQPTETSSDGDRHAR